METQIEILTIAPGRKEALPAASNGDCGRISAAEGAQTSSRGAPHNYVAPLSLWNPSTLPAPHCRSCCSFGIAHRVVARLEFPKPLAVITTSQRAPPVAQDRLRAVKPPLSYERVATSALATGGHGYRDASAAGRLLDPGAGHHLPCGPCDRSGAGLVCCVPAPWLASASKLVASGWVLHPLPTPGLPAQSDSCSAQGLSGSCNSCVCCCYAASAGFVTYTPSSGCTCDRVVDSSRVKSTVVIRYGTGHARGSRGLVTSLRAGRVAAPAHPPLERSPTCPHPACSVMVVFAALLASLYFSGSLCAVTPFPRNQRLVSTMLPPLTATHHRGY